MVLLKRKALVEILPFYLSAKPKEIRTQSQKKKKHSF